jgi:hypothetical protein
VLIALTRGRLGYQSDFGQSQPNVPTVSSA